MRRIAALGCFFVWPSLLTRVDAATPPSPDAVQKVTTQQFDVVFEVESESLIESACLWYSTDDGRTWIRHGSIDGAVSMISFSAAKEGLYGFFITVSSQAGSSSPPPDAETEPHHWAMVDYTAPVVQLHPIVQSDPPTASPVLHLKWSALDNSLPARPVRLNYRTDADGRWTSIEGPMANTGSFDWRVADGVDGQLTIRLTVRDTADHISEAVSEPFRILRPVVPEERPHASEPRHVSPPESRLTALSADNELDRRSRAFKLFQQGRLHSMRTEYRLAASRLRDALAVDPELTGALVELGRVLYAEGKVDESIEAYRLALAQEPGSRAAAEGIAVAYIGQRRFADAVRELSRIVRTDPRDVEAWLNLGDIAVYQGDELLAREHYEKAMTLDQTATEVVARARLRLADLKKLAAEFRQSEPVR